METPQSPARIKALILGGIRAHPRTLALLLGCTLSAPVLLMALWLGARDRKVEPAETPVYQGTMTGTDGSTIAIIDMAEGTGGVPEPGDDPGVGTPPEGKVAVPTDSVKESRVPAAAETKTILVASEPEPEPTPPAKVAQESVDAEFNIPDRLKDNETAFAGGKLRFNIYDERLGFRPRPNVTARICKKIGDQTVFDSVYTIDAYSRRVTPPVREAKPDGTAILFFGCSYPFGWGVNDNETFPAYTAAALPGAVVYNYGIGGTGVQHVYEQMLSDRVSQEAVVCRQAVAVYVFMDVHIQRLVGTPQIVRSFGKHFPWYELDPATGQPVRKGVFSERGGGWHPNLVYRMLNGRKNWYGEYIIREDVDLAVKLLAASKKIFEQKFQSRGFYVLVFPWREGAWVDTVLDGMRSEKARILDYRNMLQGKDEDFFIQNDGHPLPLTHERVARKLVKDLQADGLFPAPPSAHEGEPGADIKAQPK